MTTGHRLATMTSRCAGGTDSRASQLFRTAGGVMGAVQRDGRPISPGHEGGHVVPSAAGGSSPGQSYGPLPGTHSPAYDVLDFVPLAEDRAVAPKPPAGSTDVPPRGPRFDCERGRRGRGSGGLGPIVVLFGEHCADEADDRASDPVERATLSQPMRNAAAMSHYREVSCPRHGTRHLREQRAEAVVVHSHQRARSRTIPGDPRVQHYCAMCTWIEDMEE